MAVSIGISVPRASGELVRVSIVAAFLLALAGAATASPTVIATRHNLSTSGGAVPPVADASQDVCVFCHTPHTDEKADSPLWNQAAESESFGMYSDAMIDLDAEPAPQGVSMACLSCHDGTIGFDRLNGGRTGAPPMAPGAQRAGLLPRTDHPVSVGYNVARDAQFNSTFGVAANELKLFGSGNMQIECASCHNPHEADRPMFVRRGNAGSGICRTCHMK